ncbi:hypothetical protein RRG08_002081 [Elysia crispata]|uniref:Acid sphingomyelinase-like phosphodiesterase 3b n=1 Tax=Elysia crispata TaxID=231223 RepID=A0AAE0ZKQ4_9GAST|nr:hypothetical protein RRG08_002081 [Elysia crispata]
MLLTINKASYFCQFWHVTDFHYDTTYFTDQLSCNDDVPTPGPYGDYWCDSPWRLVQSTVDFMAAKTRQHKNVDFVIWTGDTVAHIADSNTSLSENLRIIERVTDLLEHGLAGIPVYASLGNHDFYPSDQAEGGQSEIYRAVGDMWKDWIGNHSHVPRFESGGFYSKTLTSAPTLRVLALNTNLYYTSNDVTEAMADPGGQFQWMEQQLKDARASGHKVLLTGHVPAAPLTHGLVNWFYAAHKTRFVNILLTYSDVIAATHFGHDHQDGFKIIQNSDGSRAVAQFTAPSVTPWRYKIKTPSGDVSGAPHNPGVRLVEYDRDSGAHLDYHQFYINLTDTNRQNQSNWAKLYSFKSAYDVSDMSVTSMRAIFARIKDGKGRAYTSRYCRHAVVSKMDTPCSDEMRGEVYCAGLHYDVPKARQCVDQYLLRLSGADSLMVNVNLMTLAATAFIVKWLL